MSKKTKKQTIKSLYERLQLEASLGTSTPNRSHKFLSAINNPLSALEVASETCTFYGIDIGLLSLFDEEIKNTMVGSFITKKFYPCTLQVHINPKLPRELIHFLIDRELDNIPKEILNHYISVKGASPAIRLKDFLKQYYPNYTEKEIKAAKGAMKRFRAERLRAFKVYRLRCLEKVIQFPVYVGRERIAQKYRNKVKKKTFVEIGGELGIEPGTARKSFSTAYELIHGTPYRKGVKIEVPKTFIEKECGTCTDRPSCEKLCPEFLAFVDQGTVTRDDHYRNIRRLQGK